ncbi:MAG: prepilin-type N-terminal cleavage/methylation domain-containing protein [Patescibacteria group bacterium]
MIKSAQKRLKGFTLIELLIVIAIIGILAAAVLIAINPGKRQRQAQDAKRKNDIGAVVTEVQGFFTTPGAGCYPLSLPVLTQQGYLKQLPTNVGGIAYDYITSGNATGCGTGGGPSEVAMYASLGDPTGATGFWCWRSSQGSAIEILAAASCSAP